MRLSIDPEVCQGHLRCLDLAPELFDADALGHGVTRSDGVVSPDQRDAAREAYETCPERAIALVDE